VVKRITDKKAVIGAFKKAAKAREDAYGAKAPMPLSMCVCGHSKSVHVAGCCHKCKCDTYVSMAAPEELWPARFKMEKKKPNMAPSYVPPPFAPPATFSRSTVTNYDAMPAVTKEELLGPLCICGHHQSKHEGKVCHGRYCNCTNFVEAFDPTTWDGVRRSESGVKIIVCEFHRGNKGAMCACQW
jgi:hypothetical protein